MAYNKPNVFWCQCMLRKKAETIINTGCIFKEGLKKKVGNIDAGYKYIGFRLCIISDL